MGSFNQARHGACLTAMFGILLPGSGCNHMSYSIGRSRHVSIEAGMPSAAIIRDISVSSVAAGAFHGYRMHAASQKHETVNKGRLMSQVPFQTF